jgi:hypothetical protein
MAFSGKAPPLEFENVFRGIARRSNVRKKKEKGSSRS